MSKRRELGDLPADIVLSRPYLLAKAYRDYHRYSVTLKGKDSPVVQERDVLIAGKVVVVIPIDVTRQKSFLSANFACPRTSPMVAAISLSLWRVVSRWANP
jgi:hypothetical protein